MPINIFPEEKVIIEFETGEIILGEMKKNGGMQQGKGGGQSGGMQGGGQGLRGDMQGGSGRGGSSRMGMERLNLDVEVKLAK
jgi:hypothetical protein